MAPTASRRTTLMTLGASLFAGTMSTARAEIVAPSLEPAGAEKLRALTTALAKAPGRRDYKTVPMILDDPALWDVEALNLVLGYTGLAKQCWDNTEIAGPWLNVMRNSMNAQIWSFRHADFLCVSATHGSAQLALYDQTAWDKYQLAKIAGGMTNNSLITMPAAAARDPAQFQSTTGPFAPANNSVVALQQRGAVFLACHNAIFELAAKLVGTTNPDRLEVEALAADLTNHLIPGIVLTPGAVATLVELQRAGFAYGR